MTREQAHARLGTEMEREKRLGVQYWPMFLRDTGKFDRDKGSYSETQALTGHVTPADAGAARRAHDAAYDAFVAMFRESSTIKQEYLTCVGKP